MVNYTFDEFESVLYGQIADAGELRHTINKYKLIPVYTTDTNTSHAFTQFLYELTELSPSHQSCKKDMGTYIFGNAVDIVEKTVPSLLYKEEDLKIVPLKEKIEFTKSLRDIGISLSSIIENSKEFFSDELDSGNFYAVVKVITAGGVKKKVTITPVKQLNVMYIDLEKETVQYALVTEKFDENWWREKKPLILPVSYPEQPMNFEKDSKGDYITLIHYKNNKLGRYYARPLILPVIDCMMAEYKTLLLNAKVASTETVSKVLLFFEEESKEITRQLTLQKRQENFNKRVYNLRAVTTNENGGKAHSIAALEYPNGTKEPKEIQIGVNRDTDYAKFTLDNAASMIYSVNGWAKELTGMVQVKTGIGANILYDLFIIKNTSSVEPNQRKYEALWAWIFNELESFMGIESKGLTIKFPDAVTSLVTKIKNVTDNEKSTQLNVISDINNKS